MNALYGTIMEYSFSSASTSSANIDLDPAFVDEHEHDEAQTGGSGDDDDDDSRNANDEQGRQRRQSGRRRSLFQNSLLPTSYQPVINNSQNHHHHDEDESSSSSSLAARVESIPAEEDDDAMMLPPVEFSTMARIRILACSRSNSGTFYKACIIFIAMAFFLLLALDVFQRFSFGWSAAAPVLSTGAALNHPPRGEPSSWSSQQRPPREEPLRRWVPVADILHDPGMPELKFMDESNMGGLQGLALDHDSNNGSAIVLYEFHTMGVRVLQLSSTRTSATDDDDDENDDDPPGILQVLGIEKSRTYNGTRDFPLLFQKPVAHIGGVDVATSQKYGTEIWIATHSADDGIIPCGGCEGALWAVDPVTLDIKPDRVVRVDGYNLDWVAFSTGVLYFGTFFNVTSIHRVALETLEPLNDLVLSLPPEYNDENVNGIGLNYIQSAVFDHQGRLVLLADDFQCTIYILDPDTGVLLASQGLLLGSETDGITFLDDGGSSTMLVGFNRGHSHEQVMGQAPMMSIIQLDLVEV